MDIASITNATASLASEENSDEFIQYASYDKVMEYISNRDLMNFGEKHIKILLLSFLGMNQVFPTPNLK